MNESTLQSRRILIALSGGISCYKIASLVSQLAKAGANTRVIMTEPATRFITPLTLQSLSGNPVLTSIFEHDTHPESQHIGLSRWCELMLIAPCSANTLSKLAHGVSDNLVSLCATALPTATPLLLSPAMNADMWENPMVQRNTEILRQYQPKIQWIGPESGWQACRTEGTGRMSEADTIFKAIESALC